MHYLKLLKTCHRDTFKSVHLKCSPAALASWQARLGCFNDSCQNGYLVLLVDSAYGIQHWDFPLTNFFFSYVPILLLFFIMLFVLYLTHELMFWRTDSTHGQLISTYHKADIALSLENNCQHFSPISNFRSL